MKERLYFVLIIVLIQMVAGYGFGGGNWQDPDTYRMIGIQVEGSTLPDTATVLTLAELQARQRDIHSRYPMKKYDMPHEEEEEREMTDEEVNSAIQAWVDART